MASIATTCKKSWEFLMEIPWELWGKQAMAMDYDPGFNGISMMS